MSGSACFYKMNQRVLQIESGGIVNAAKVNDIDDSEGHIDIVRRGESLAPAMAYF